MLPQRYVFSSKSQRERVSIKLIHSCYCYHKGTYFQANHNTYPLWSTCYRVVIATTKVRIFKQITTSAMDAANVHQLLLLPQRYVFSSKSQLQARSISCCVCCYCYHKGTYFQANHNQKCLLLHLSCVVIATTKVRIFKQITTVLFTSPLIRGLLLLPQRYVFSSKSQPQRLGFVSLSVVIATTKVRIFKQITTSR